MSAKQNNGWRRKPAEKSEAYGDSLGHNGLITKRRFVGIWKSQPLRCRQLAIARLSGL